MLALNLKGHCNCTYTVQILKKQGHSVSYHSKFGRIQLNQTRLSREKWVVINLPFVLCSPLNKHIGLDQCKTLSLHITPNKDAVARPEEKGM